MEALYILILPFVWLLAMKFVLRTTFNFAELGISLVAVTIVVVSVIQVGKFGATQDTEIWNGQITGKQRVQDYWEESYDCNCTTDKDGYESCSTCYRDHYTVDWFATSTLGKFTFKALDSEWKSVYDTPDPARYTKCKVGEPASKEHSYTNYVQAVPQSLFHDTSKVQEQFAGKIPSYPRVYDYYRINRVIALDTKISTAEVANLNNKLNETLIHLGKTKQANIVVVLTEIDDPTYRYAVENAWQGGEKNDIVIFIGLDDHTITWVDIMTWALNSGNEYFHVEMRDGIKAMKNFNADELVAFVGTTTYAKFDRPHMGDYEYLKDEIDPPTWTIWLAIVLAFVISGGLTLFFHINEIGGTGYNGPDRSYRFRNRNRF